MPTSQYTLPPERLLDLVSKDTTPESIFKLAELARIECEIESVTSAITHELAEMIGGSCPFDGDPLLADWSGRELLVVPRNEEDIDDIIEKLSATSLREGTYLLAIIPRTDDTHDLDGLFEIDEITLTTTPVIYPESWGPIAYWESWIIGLGGDADPTAVAS